MPVCDICPLGTPCVHEAYQQGRDYERRICADDMRDAYEEQEDWMVRASQYKHILLDLIAELREEHARAACPDACGYQYDHCECGDEWDGGFDACVSMAATYNAEARLKEVQGE